MEIGIGFFLGTIISALVIGSIVGALGRLIVPGRQDMPIWLTIVIGIIAALLGAAIMGELHHVLLAHPDSAGGVGSDRRLPHLRDTWGTPRAQSRLTPDHTPDWP